MSYTVIILMAAITFYLKCLILLVLGHFSDAILVQYLRGNYRYNSSAIKDYYFSCSAVGQTLQWSVNRLGLGGFFTGSNAGDLLTSFRPNFTYSASLLSKRTLTQSQLNFTSVLLISALYELHLEVACRTESEQEITSNVKGLTHIVSKEANHFVHLQYVFNEHIVSNTALTSVFLCEVDGLSMSWKANANYDFGLSDVIGASGQELYTEGGRSVVEEQAILIAREPYPFVSLLVITNYSGITVVCGSEKDTVHVSTPATTDDIVTTETLRNSSVSVTPTIMMFTEISGIHY